MILVRKANIWDYDTIESLHQQLSDLHAQWASWNFHHIRPSYTKELFTERLEDAETFVFVAEDKWIIVAYVIFQVKHSDDYPILKKRSWLFIKDIVVTESEKWKWIGTLLMEKWEEIAQEMNLWSLELHVWSFNEEAIEFYKKRWYEPYAIKMRKEI
jgi:GNAT superfamily N-acetyltransferase